jgi:opacity protein-like surface antigen
LKSAAALVLFLLIAAPAAAQVRIPPQPRRGEPNAVPRVYLLATVQQFAAADTFETAFGRAVQPFFGGGIEVVFRNGLFVDGAVSFFRKTGERAFVFEDEVFPLGVSLKARVTPIELTTGYRFARRNSKMTPYVGGGIGAYFYREESDFDESGEVVESTSAGYLALAGVEFALSRRIFTAFDVQYSFVPGILGDGGISQELGDENLGGIAFRFRLMVGN